MLLALFRRKLKLRLPADARTLLKTPTQVGLEIQPILGGHFWYQGIEYVLMTHFNNTTPRVDRFRAQIFIDWLPLFNSSARQLWPILMKVVELPEAPVMLLGVFCGHTKPDNVEGFLRPLVTEANDLQKRGLQFGEKNVRFKLHMFVADSPARCFAKATISYVGRNSCLKCTCEGTQVGRKIVFEDADAQLRTDLGFRGREDQKHHKAWKSPLEDIDELDMIKDIIIADGLHVRDLGVSKKIATGIFNHTFARFSKWTDTQKETVSSFLMKIQLPGEIQRRFRHIKFSGFWKGTEYRSFLFYASVIIYKDFMWEEAFQHYLLYFCAHTIFATKTHKHFWPQAKMMFKEFLKGFANIYGREHITSNVHNLIHIYDDCDRFGSMEEISTYDFENHLQLLKRLMRSGNRCTEQVITRSREIETLKKATNIVPPKFPTLIGTGSGLRLRCDFYLMMGFRNAWFLTTDNHVVEFLSAKEVSNSYFTIEGSQFESNVELFNLRKTVDNFPIQLSSSDIFIYKIKKKTLLAVRFSFHTIA
uniref:uncharacterized protein LOC120961283 n=1 Tax=Anopheles coluzzii TaxID=1518534 RepID=UPI0020FF8264|nr:uncharacterized protein LOC120961283 [Anopheles coluzzii]